MHGSHYINGEWTTGTSLTYFSSFNPSTGVEIAKFPIGEIEDINNAVAAAKQAQKSWRELSRIKRGEYINNLRIAVQLEAERIERAISEETGKSLNESRAEVNEAIHMLEYTYGKCRMPIGEIVPSEIADKDAYIIRKPKGVVAVISPWNFPFAIGGFWTSAPAILEGNTVVFKPSEETPMVGELIAELYSKCFPVGVFNLVIGDGNTGKALVEHKDVNHICFTGSYATGRLIQLICADQGKKSCSCEMGSKSAVIVCADSDMDMAVKAAIASAYKLSGQRCVSAGRILIEHQIFGEFAARFVNASRWLKVGNPFDCAESPPDMGPLISESQRDKVEKYNEATTIDSATQVLLPGYRVGTNGYFLTPHVYTTKWQENETRCFLKEEVFGPNIALIPFDDLDEAINIYNDTDFGLSVSVLTNDYKKMRRIRNECEFGLGYVNLPCIGAESSLPFGGIKKSGYGGSSAAATFDAVVHKVTWTVNHADEIQMAQGLKL